MSKEKKDRAAGLPRIMLAGTKSGCGKTVLTSLFLRLFLDCGLTPALLKCGPDYLDPLFHRSLCGVETGNLDSVFMTEKELRKALARIGACHELALIEGVMGYYDGIAGTAEASTAEVAALTDTPVILVVDAKGRAGSAAAELCGFLRYHPFGSNIRGVIFNRLSPKLYPLLSKEAEKLGVKPLGFLPEKEVFRFPSRYLGLVTPDGNAEVKEKITAAAKVAEETLAVDAVLELAEEAVMEETEAGFLRDTVAEEAVADFSRDAVVEEAVAEFSWDAVVEETMTEFSRDAFWEKRVLSDPTNTVSKKSKDTPRIAIAEDEAFCFYYRESKELLKELGAQLLLFSPLRDAALPACDGLILPGGYPELYAAELEKNETMRKTIFEAICSGLPTIAECGGFLYLHETLTDREAKVFSMAGVLAGGCHLKGLHPHFGYVTIRAEEDFLLAKTGETIRAHEFHYYESDAPGEALSVRKVGAEEYANAVHKDSPNIRKIHRENVLEKEEARFLENGGSLSLDTMQVDVSEQKKREWRSGYASPTLYAGFPHIPLFTNDGLPAKRFLMAAGSRDFLCR